MTFPSEEAAQQFAYDHGLTGGDLRKQADAAGVDFIDGEPDPTFGRQGLATFRSEQARPGDHELLDEFAGTLDTHHAASRPVARGLNRGSWPVTTVFHPTRRTELGRPPGGVASGERVAMTVKTEGVAARRSAARPSSRGTARAAGDEQLSRADRVALGKDARAAAPLEPHAEFAPAGKRDPVGLLLEQAKARVPELVPVRHGRMLVSAFTFYRGAALPMAARGGP